MAKDRLIFFISLAVLGLIAAFLFRSPETKPDSETKKSNLNTVTGAPIEVLFANSNIKANDPITPENVAWRTIEVKNFDLMMITKTPDIERMLGHASAAKDIAKDANIMKTDISWPLEIENQDKESYILMPGKRAVPYKITERFGLLQFIKPGTYVDIMYSSKADVGFGPISITLLKNIKVLAVGQEETKGFKFAAPNLHPNSPVEVLLEMTTKEADIFSYAENSGTVSLGFVENDPNEKNSELQKKLLTSKSLGDFSSIFVTDMIRSLFPDVNVEVTALPNGYIASGKVPDPQKAAKIIEVLNKISPEGKKSVVNLIESDAPNPKPEDHSVAPSSQEEKVESVIIPPEKGKRAVLYNFVANDGMLPFIEAGTIVDVNFATNSDIGFGAVSLTLLKNIRVLGIDKEIEKNHFKRNSDPSQSNLNRQILLEMTPRQAEIFSYARETGSISLTFDEENSEWDNEELSEMLLKSRSKDNFRSILITYMVRALFPGVYVDVTATAKGYVVSGQVSDPQTAIKIMEVIQRLARVDENSIVNLMDVQPQQVLLSVKVFEINKTVTESLGLNWEVLFKHHGGSTALAAVFPSPISPAPNYSFSANGIQMGEVSLSMLIDMLEEIDAGRVLAEPNLTTVSGKKAHFFAGGEFPVLIPQGGALLGTVTVEYKKFGVLLDFIPWVDLNGLITLDVIPEVSRLDRANSVILSGFVIPGLDTRRVETTVKLWPGQSYVIAGLLESEHIEKNFSLFGLSRLPIIGPLFTSNNFMNQQTELMIMVTPFLVSTDKNDVCVSDCADIPAGPCRPCGTFNECCEHITPMPCGYLYEARGDVGFGSYEDADPYLIPGGYDRYYNRREKYGEPMPPCRGYPDDYYSPPCRDYRDDYYSPKEQQRARPCKNCGTIHDDSVICQWEVY